MPGIPTIVVLLFQRGLTNALVYAFASYALNVLVIVAAFAFFDLWDFRSHPTQLIYLALYLIIGVGALHHFIRYGTGRERQP